MSSINFLSNCADCYEMIEFLLSKDNKNLLVYLYELAPVTALRYKGYHFYLKYNKDYFARITQTEFVGDEEKANEALVELSNLISGMIGNPIAYYEMSFKEAGQEKINPTIEWCLNNEIIDKYISDIVNDQFFDDGGKCLNVKLFGKRRIEDYNKGPQLSLKLTKE